MHNLPENQRTEIESVLASHADEVVNVGRRSLTYHSNAINHLTNVDGFTQQRGVIGGHNLTNFESYIINNAIDINILTTVDSPIDGLIELSYQIRKADGSGEWKNTIFRKTLYDPSKISDAKMTELGQEAIKEGLNSIIIE
ncbi:MAG: hypothetical protein RL662_1123 [Bacteroidota bacterium]